MLLGRHALVLFSILLLLVTLLPGSGAVDAPSLPMGLGAPDPDEPDQCVPEVDEGGGCQRWRSDATFSHVGYNVGLSVVEQAGVAYVLLLVVDDPAPGLIGPIEPTSGLVAYAMDTGTELWRAELEPSSGLAVADGVLYVLQNELHFNGIWSSRVVALSTEGGAPLWTHDVLTGETNRATGLLAHDGGVYVTVQDAIRTPQARIVVRALTVEGNLDWESIYEDEQPVHIQSFALMAGQPVVMGRSWGASSGAAFALALDAEDGERAWLTVVDEGQDSRPWMTSATTSTDDSRLYIAGASFKSGYTPEGQWKSYTQPRLWALDVSTGAIAWAYSPDGAHDAAFRHITLDEESATIVVGKDYRGMSPAAVAGFSLAGEPLGERSFEHVYSAPRVFARDAGGAIALAERYHQTGVGHGVDLVVSALTPGGQVQWERRVQPSLGHDVPSDARLTASGEELLVTLGAPRAIVSFAGGSTAPTYLLDVRDPAFAAPASAGTDGADAELVAVSVEGDARATGWCTADPVLGGSACVQGVAVSGLGDAEGGAGAASGTGAATAEGCYYEYYTGPIRRAHVCDLGIALAGTGDADGSLVAASGLGNATHTGEYCRGAYYYRCLFRQGGVAAAGVGDASAGQGYAVSGLGDARGSRAAASGGGDASSGLPISGANSCNGHGCIDVSPEGDARGHYLAFAADGDARCDEMCVTTHGNSTGGWLAFSTHGRADNSGNAVSIWGDSSGSHAVSVFGNSSGGVLDQYGSVVSVFGNATTCRYFYPHNAWCVAISGTGYAEGFVAVSVFGDAHCADDHPTYHPTPCRSVSIFGRASGEGETFSGCERLSEEGHEELCADRMPSLLP